MRGIHRRPVNSQHKGPVTRKMFPLDDVLMCVVWNNILWMHDIRIFPYHRCIRCINTTNRVGRILCNTYIQLTHMLYLRPCHFGDILWVELGPISSISACHFRCYGRLHVTTCRMLKTKQKTVTKEFGIRQLHADRSYSSHRKYVNCEVIKFHAIMMKMKKKWKWKSLSGSTKYSAVRL